MDHNVSPACTTYTALVGLLDEALARRTAGVEAGAPPRFATTWPVLTSSTSTIAARTKSAMRRRLAYICTAEACVDRRASAHRPGMTTATAMALPFLTRDRAF